jgi:hypothetical protein
MATENSRHSRTACSSRPDLHAVQNQRLTGFNAVAFWRIQRNGHDARLLQQGFIRRAITKLLLGSPSPGISSNVLPVSSVLRLASFRELRTAHFDTRFLAQEIDHARVDGHFAGHRAAGLSVILVS